LNSKAPRRFKFILYNNYKFNYKIIVNIIYLDSNKLVLYVINAITSFNVVRFL
ncbi:hypothetical protein LX36DRAFT_585465, partial [Colletotrichum falcatum]